MGGGGGLTVPRAPATGRYSFERATGDEEEVSSIKEFRVLIVVLRRGTSSTHKFFSLLEERKHKRIG